MTVKRVMKIILIVVLLALAFTYLEARKVYRQNRSDSRLYSYFRDGYNYGWDDSTEGLSFDPETACNKCYLWVDENGGVYKDWYSKMSAGSAAFVSGYSYGYYDGQQDNGDDHSSAVYEWRDDYYNPYFNRIAILLNIR